MFVIVHDISERKKAEKQVQLLVTLVDQAADGIIITDVEGNIQYTNPAFQNDTGYSEQELIGENCRLLKSGKHNPEFYSDLWETILSGRKWQNIIINKRKRD